MSKYIDGFVLPISRAHIEAYRSVVAQIKDVWLEYGALDYVEFVNDEDAGLAGTRGFADAANAEGDDVTVLGWVVFKSREHRDLINEQVAADPRMPELMAPLMNTNPPIFNAQKMVYGGFSPLV